MQLLALCASLGGRACEETCIGNRRLAVRAIAVTAFAHPLKRTLDRAQFREPHADQRMIDIDEQIGVRLIAFVRRGAGQIRVGLLRALVLARANLRAQCLFGLAQPLMKRLQLLFVEHHHCFSCFGFRNPPCGRTPRTAATPPVRTTRTSRPIAVRRHRNGCPFVRRDP